MNIVICEDTEKDANLLRLLIEKYFLEINCLGEIFLYESGDAFLKDFAAGRINDVIIAFLDIFMPGTNGIDTAKKIRETDKDMVIIFTTTSKDHGLDGYSVDARQYFLKPVNYAELENVLNKCMEKFADSLKYIEVLSDRLTVKVYLKNIIFIESFDAVLHIHTVNARPGKAGSAQAEGRPASNAKHCERETIKTFLSLSALEQQLNNSTFLRAQRSYIVNMCHIKRMTDNGFLMENDMLIPFRKNDKLAVKQAYRDYLSALTWEEGN